MQGAHESVPGLPQGYGLTISIEIHIAMGRA